MCKRGLFLLLRGKEENMKNVSEELWLFIINLLLQLKYQSTQLLWSWYFPLEVSFVEVWLSAAGAESFICSTVKSINTYSNHSVAHCYRRRDVTGSVDKEVAVCAVIITCIKVGSQWEKPSHSLQTCVCESYTGGCRVFTVQHLKEAVNADKGRRQDTARQGWCGWSISIKFSYKFSISLWLDHSRTFTLLTLNHFCSFHSLNCVILVENMSL